MYEYVYLGSTPGDEDCAQVGSDDYGQRSRAETLAYVRQLRRIVAAEGRTIPEGASLVIKREPHDFGQYTEVVVRYDLDEADAEEFAYWLEGILPANWDAEALAELSKV